MDDNNTTVTPADASEDPKTEETPQEEVQNAESTGETSAQPASEVDAPKEESGEEQVDTPVAKAENDAKSEAGKMSKLEKENNEYRQAQQIVDALNSAATADPEFMRAANKKLVEQGVLDESVLEGMDVPAPTTEGSNVEANPAVKWAQSKMKEEQDKRVEFFKNFEEKHPDLSEGKPEVIKANRTAIGAAAAKHMAEGNSSMEESYEYAYKLMMNPKELIEEGRLTGIAQAQSATPTEGAASGGSANSSGGVELTSEQKEAASLFGVSEEEYAKGLGT